MKQFTIVVLGLTLVAVGAVSCSSDDVAKVEIPKKEFKPLSLAEFNKIALGNGWVEAETHEILDNGKISTEDFYEGREGEKPRRYEFDRETSTTFVYLENPGVNAYYERALHYDETTGKVYFGDIERFTVLSANEKEMVVNKLYAVRENNKGYHKDVYHRVRLTKMSADELLDTKHKYWINGDDLERDMTPNDLCHKWILTYFDSNSLFHPSYSIYQKRKSDQNYIRFWPDGTIEGRSDETEFRGTYKWTSEMQCPDDSGIFFYIDISITPDENGGEWPELFKYMLEVERVSIQYGYYINLLCDLNGHDHHYTFIRGFDD